MPLLKPVGMKLISGMQELNLTYTSNVTYLKGVGEMENGEEVALHVKEAHTMWKSRNIMLKFHGNYFSTNTRKRKEQRNCTLRTYY